MDVKALTDQRNLDARTPTICTIREQLHMSELQVKEANDNTGFHGR